MRLLSEASGLRLSAFSRTPQPDFVLNFFLLNRPLIVSELAFPIPIMPKTLQLLTVINPLRYSPVVIRAVFIKGAGIDILRPDLAAIAVLGMGMLTLSLMWLRKSLDRRPNSKRH